MSRYNLKKRLARLGDQVDDFIDEANDTYESIRHDVKRTAKDIKGRAYDVKDRRRMRGTIATICSRI